MAFLTMQQQSTWSPIWPIGVLLIGTQQTVAKLALGRSSAKWFEGRAERTLRPLALIAD
jgi:hypothetical protein